MMYKLKELLRPKIQQIVKEELISKTKLRESNQRETLRNFAEDYLDFVGGIDELRDIEKMGGWKKDRRSVEWFRDKHIKSNRANDIFSLTLDIGSK